MAATVFVSSEAFAASDVAETPSFTVGGANRVLYARMFGVSAGAMTHVGVNWQGSGGVSMTQVGSTATIGSFLTVSLWRLIAPAAVNDTVIGQVTGASFVGIHAVQMQDTDQVTPNGTVASANGTNTTPSVSASSASGEIVIDFMSWADSGGNNRACTVDASQTSLQEIEGADISFGGGACSRETASGASTTMSWTLSGAISNWHTHAFQVNPVGGGGATTRGTPFGHEGTAFAGGRTFHGIIQ